ncbi:stage V sporulation protein AA [Salibacterium salarium]|uniref:Stage V sporulation protein AA n=1 Tax=Salibacterium salarium TaxID=284579 RepID=A0A428N8C8_9BACI|nr:stage V sporulation protein AA [Salibacterium salarium]RSL34617.1 stage V sporulation protein AA [Salibacterium salarium]
MEQHIYLQFFSKGSAVSNQTIYVKDIARLEGKSDILPSIMELPIYKINAKDKSHVVIDALTVLQQIHSFFPQITVHVIGREQTVLEIKIQRKIVTPVMLVLVWFLLFIGAALAIMNFHEDVSMLSVHQKLYSLITGKNLTQPLLLQIPYSFGLGLGMILFFNHLFKKRINEEPSPLEIEMFQYRQEIENYLAETNTDRRSKPWQSKSYSPFSSD